jgi:uncharacterized RDD family membrane protein YckC
MSDQYYLQEGDKKTGPFTYDELVDIGLEVNSRLASGNSSTWQNASDLPEFNDYFEWRGYYFPTENNLATFWWRLLAYFIDLVVLYILSIIAAPFIFAQLKIDPSKIDLDTVKNMDDTTKLLITIGVFLVFTIYNTLQEASPMRGSIGKRLCKLVVVDANGKRLTLLKAFLRNVFKFISEKLLYIGYIHILWDEHRQGWHDQWAGTYIVRRGE